MSARRKPPDADENKRTALFDSGKHARRAATPPEYDEGDPPTVVDGPLAQAMLEQPAPLPGDATVHDRETLIDRPAPIQVISKKQAASGPVHAMSMKGAASVRAISMKDSASVQAISMKTPAQTAPTDPGHAPTPMLPRPRLRPMSEVTPANQQNLGRVAPPYDPEEARARQLREYVIWGCIAVMLASAIALVVWFVAR